MPKLSSPSARLEKEMEEGKRLMSCYIATPTSTESGFSRRSNGISWCFSADYAVASISLFLTILMKFYGLCALVEPLARHRNCGAVAHTEKGR